MAFNTVLIISIYFLEILVTRINSVPPERCFTTFRWDDCGKPPTPVIYYYKSGSRCEVGMWRGCYPNENMFENEYECVATCIFTQRALPADFHNLIEQPEGEYDFDMTTEADLNVTAMNDTMSTDANMTDTTGTGETGETGTGDGDADGGDGDAAATKAEGEGEGEGGEGEAAPEGEPAPEGEEAPAEEK